MYTQFIRSLSVFACYDDDDSSNGEGETNSGEGEGSGEGSGESSGKSGEVKFDAAQQALFNRKMKEQKEALQKKVEEKVAKAQADMKAFAEQNGLTEAQLKQAHENLEAVEAQLRSKDEQAKLDEIRIKKEYATKLEAETARADKAEKLYERSIINQAITKAVDTHNGKRVAQFTKMFGDDAKLVDGEAVLVFDDYTVEGDPMVSEMPPLKALERMKELEDYENLFNREGAGGAGGDSGANNSKAGNKKIDWANISQDEYNRIAKEEPHLLET